MDMEFMDDENQKRQEAERARLMRERQIKLGSVVRALADSRDGQYFLRWIFEECSVFRQEFPRDEKLSAWNAGRRAFGLQILGLCAAENCADTLFANKELTI